MRLFKLSILLIFLLPIRIFSQELLKQVKLKNGTELNYISKGTGRPIIFVHGSLSDYSYWHVEIDSFSKYFNAKSYSRRYNRPNKNIYQKGYSAKTDGEDLSQFISALGFKSVIVVGHSYGALTALFLAVNHPGQVEKLVIAEPPLIPLLKHLLGKNRKKGRTVYRDIKKNLEAPMSKLFKSGDYEEGVGHFIDYVLKDSTAWRKMSGSAKSETMANIDELKVIFKGGTFFPPLSKSHLKKIKCPVLMISGAKSYEFLPMIDHELHKVLRNSKQVIIHDASHGMWYSHEQLCRESTLSFLRQ